MVEGESTALWAVADSNPTGDFDLLYDSDQDILYVHTYVFLVVCLFFIYKVRIVEVVFINLLQGFNTSVHSRYGPGIYHGFL